ncbi:hypothetical protein LMG27177_05697 [Paraburkholderia fynbosensis]|uniref:Uncharacterized protein n=1 Tax=Paraburkholderia fynbosensis TaxID=1200993 RepID=A0A6J5GSG6_9BURK|nr:hypothetical protein LMG27177_05697 [Paraburkholderia fynbosensis]
MLIIPFMLNPLLQKHLSRVSTGNLFPVAVQYASRPLGVPHAGLAK